jgi:hypothetical protein
MTTPALTVILRINIGERDHHWVTEDRVRDEARRLHPTDDQACRSLERELDRRAVTPRQWRALAREIDHFAEEAMAVPGAARFLIIGRAPLPVFAYLGARMTRAEAPIHFANVHDGNWEFYEPPNRAPAGGREDFRVEQPNKTTRRGQLALSLRTSNDYGGHDESLSQFVAAEGGELLATYSIVHTKNKSEHPLGPAELPVIMRHVDDAFAWMGEHAPKRNGLVIPLACPAWLAFWVGHRINPNVWGRVDFPNFVPGEGYVPALSVPMNRAPWFHGPAKLLVLNAEPHDQFRTHASRSFDTIQSALESKLGRNSDRLDIRLLGAAKIPQLIDEIEEYQPDILHLHMHGSEIHGLAFEDERGKAAGLSPRGFVRRLEAANHKPTLIVLSSCESDSLGEPLCGVAECVIVMRGKVETDRALAFSQFFYTSLARGNNLARAIEQGKIEAEVEWVEDHCVDDVDKKDVVLFPRVQ